MRKCCLLSIPILYLSLVDVNAAIVTPDAVSSSTAANDTYPAINLINGNGLSSTPTDTNIVGLEHSIAGSTVAWVSAASPGNYYDGAPVPVLTFDFDTPQMIDGFAYWGYTFSDVGLGSGNEGKTFAFRFYDQNDQEIGDVVHRTAPSPAMRASRVISLPERVGVSQIVLRLIDNHHNAANPEATGGNRVGLGEVRFLNNSSAIDPADFEPDGIFTVRDLAAFQSRFFKGTTDLSLDLNSNGFVQSADYQVLLDRFATEGGTSLLVNTRSDSGGGTGSLSLRQAIDSSSHLAPGTMISFESILPELSFEVVGEEIVIPATEGLFIDALTNRPFRDTWLEASASTSNPYRVLRVADGANVSFFGLGFTGGRPGRFSDSPSGEFGGGILNQGTLSLISCAVSGCRTTSGGDVSTGFGGAGGHGGGIYNEGILTLIRSTLSDNVAGNGGNFTGGGSDFGGGGHGGRGGALSCEGISVLSQCTITGNSSGAAGPQRGTGSNGGGGGVASTGSLFVQQSTIVENTGAGPGGGILTESGTVILQNSIVALNAAGSDHDDISSNNPVDARGKNLLSEVTGSGLTVGDSSLLISSDPALAPLDNYGRFPPTRPPLASSPAIDAAEADAGLLRDQRRLERTRAALSGGNVLPDIGATEFQGKYLYVRASNDGILDGSTWGNAMRLFESALSVATPSQSILVAEGVYSTGGTSSGFTVRDGVDIYGGYEDTGNPAFGDANAEAFPTLLVGNGTLGESVLTYQDITSAVTLSGVTLTTEQPTQGLTYPDHSGLLIEDSTGPIMIENCKIVGLREDNGGGANVIDSTASFANTLFQGNFASSVGGAISIEGSTCDFLNCTFHGNHCSQSSNGAIFSSNSDLSFTNTIIWNNVGDRSGTPTTAGLGTSISVGTRHPDITFRSCLVQNWTPTDLGHSSNFDGTNSASDPLFVTSIGLTESPTTNGDSRLLANSPMIDVSSAQSNSSLIALGGNARVLGSAIDLGAYESDDLSLSTTLDSDSDGTSNFLETLLGRDYLTPDADSPQSVQALSGQTGISFGRNLAISLSVQIDIYRSFDLDTFVKVYSYSPVAQNTISSHAEITPQLMDDLIILNDSNTAGKIFYQLRVIAD